MTRKTDWMNVGFRMMLAEKKPPTKKIKMKNILLLRKILFKMY